MGRLRLSKVFLRPMGFNFKIKKYEIFINQLTGLKHVMDNHFAGQQVKVPYLFIILF